MQKTLEQYLRDSHRRKAIDHTLRCHVREDGSVTFYVHPLNIDGDTLDFVVNGNVLEPDPQIEKGK